MLQLIQTLPKRRSIPWRRTTFWRPQEVVPDAVLALFTENIQMRTDDMAVLLECNNISAEDSLHELPSRSKLGWWIPHQLRPDQLQHKWTTAIPICRSTQWRTIVGKSSRVMRSMYCVLTNPQAAMGLRRRRTEAGAEDRPSWKEANFECLVGFWGKHVSETSQTKYHNEGRSLL